MIFGDLSEREINSNSKQTLFFAATSKRDEKWVCLIGVWMEVREVSGKKMREAAGENGTTDNDTSESED